RSTFSVFGSDREAPTQFDARDGQVLLAFDTDLVIPPGGTAAGYVVRSAEITLQVANNLVFRLDTTTDPFTNFLPSNDARFTADADLGQPIELFGVGFRGGWSETNFVETAPFANAGSSFLSPGVRNVFAAEVDSAGAVRDVSNNPRQGFQAKPFAIGKVTGLASGSLVPQDSIVRFQVDVSDGGIQTYLCRGLDRGRLFLAVSALTLVQQQAGDFPVFYSKENALVTFGLAQAPRLRIKVDTVPVCASTDLDCNGTVDTGDIAIALLEFGPCPGCPSDIDGTGFVDFGDVALIMLDFG
ncbi:MAG: hypothetical protein ACKPEA_16025, partial [Planctomycetota bacterium]